MSVQRTPPVLLHCGRTESGATMLEFTFAIIVLLAFFSLIFDFGIGYQKYGVVSEVLDQVVRTKAAGLENTEFVQNTDEYCATLKDDLQKAIKTRLDDVDKTIKLDPPLDSDSNVVLANTTDSDRIVAAADKTHTPLFLSVRRTMPFPCAFCFFFPKGFSITVRSRTLIENANFRNCVAEDQNV